MLDLRYMLSGVFLILLLLRAVVLAFRKRHPLIPALPLFSFNSAQVKTDSIISITFRPVLIILDVVLLLLQRVVNILWRLLATVFAYLKRIGVNLGNQCYDIISNGSMWLTIVRTMVTYIALIAFAYSVIPLTQDARFYLTVNSSFAELSSVSIPLVYLGRMLLFFICTLLVIALICWMWRIKDFSYRLVYCGSLYLVSYAFSAVIVYLLRAYSNLNIVGFSSIGLYTTIFATIIILVFVFQLAKRLVDTMN
jgi:hypothetical protein